MSASKPNTTVVNKRIVFLKDDAGWYADMEGTRAQNAMVSGADKMIEALSGGGSRVEMVFSSDVEEPGDHIMKLHRIACAHAPCQESQSVDFLSRGQYAEHGNDHHRLSGRQL